MRGRTAIVGLGSTPYYKRGQSAPQTAIELVGKATIAAVEDAGLKIGDVDGFAYFAGGFDSGMLTETLGIPELRFSATLTGTRSEEHTSDLQSLMRISYAVFCLK